MSSNKEYPTESNVTYEAWNQWDYERDSEVFSPTPVEEKFQTAELFVRVISD